MNPRFLAYRRAPRAELLRAMSDEELAELIAYGHDEAFEALVIRHRRGLLSHCSQLVGRADAEEAVQDALLRAYLSLSRGHAVQHVGAWLRTIAHNTSLNLLRARAARAVPGEHDPSDFERDQFERREHLRIVMEALGSLPKRQREALVMRELEGRSYAEIESRLHASNGAVRQLLNRARARVRTRLATLAGLEPALRWMVGNGSPGSSAVRLGALGGGCAVTVKLCTTALLPATLGPGALVVPRAALPAPRRHAVTTAARSVKRVAARARVSGAAAPTVVTAVSYHSPTTTYVVYHPVSSVSWHPASRVSRTTTSTPRHEARRQGCAGASSSPSSATIRTAADPGSRAASAVTSPGSPRPSASSSPGGSATGNSRPGQDAAGPSASAEGPSSSAP